MVWGTKLFLDLNGLCSQLTQYHIKKQLLQVLTFFSPMLEYRFNVKGSSLQYALPQAVQQFKEGHK